MTQYLVYEHKQGDTLDFTGVLVNTDNEFPDLTGWSGLSQIRNASDNSLIEELTFSWLDETSGMCRIKSVNDTSSWSLGHAILDIQLTTNNGEIISTPTVNVIIVEDVTQ